MHTNKKLMATAATVLLSTSISASASWAQTSCDGAELIQDGKLVVAYNGDMPGTGMRDGKLVGVDGEMMSLVAERLGLELSPQLMEWAAEIESVKSRRVDIMHGMMGWTEPRTEVIAMTDPIYYPGSLMTQRKGQGVTSLEQVKGLRIATIQGYAQAPELATLNPDVMLYETADAAIRDLVAGRVDVLFIDPPIVQYLAASQPDLEVESIPVPGPFDPTLPILTGKFQVVFGMSKDAPKLQQCINDAIAEMWNSCENHEIASKYGLSDTYWFTPQEENPRRGVDRPENWEYPRLGNCG